MHHYSRRLRAAAMAMIVCLVSDPAFASPRGGHLVTREQVTQSLCDAATARENDRRLLHEFLEAPFVLEVASRLRVEPARLHAAVATLSDKELHDLAQRTAALGVDPAAGQAYGLDLPGLDTVVVICGVLLVLIVVGAVTVIGWIT